MNIRTLMGICFIFSALAPLSAFAATYKWVDKDGVTHYSQSRPDRAPYEVIESKSKDPAQKTAPAAPASAPAKPTAPTTPNPAEDVISKEELAEKCQKVRDEMTKLESIARVRLKQGDEAKILSAEEKQALIDERRDWLANYCN